MTCVILINSELHSRTVLKEQGKDRTQELLCIHMLMVAEAHATTTCV